MLKKIYEELVAIRKELHAIRNGMESQETVYAVRKPYSMQVEIAGRPIFQPAHTPVESAERDEPDKWRRFELISENLKDIERLETLCKEKGLTRQDLAVILFTLHVRPGFQRSDFGI